MSRETKSPLLSTEDWWAIWFGAIFIIYSGGVLLSGGLLPGAPSLSAWTWNPLDAFSKGQALAYAFILPVIAVVTAIGVKWVGHCSRAYLRGFIPIFVLALAAQLTGAQTSVAAYNIEYALWAIVIGLLIANTVGTPAWLLAGAHSEMFIKTGLVLMGAEVLLQRIVQLGLPGLIVAWVVTPVVIVFMVYVGRRVLNMASLSLVVVIACCASVCGVSAAIASAAACRAKKEELTLAIGVTMVFTVIMMIGMPALCRLIGLDEFVGGAWIGGTIDSTGAVAASGAMLGKNAEQVAAIVKLIQNALIGFIAFAIAVIWVARIERDPSGPKPSALEIWRRFPKFILGFLAASALFSLILTPLLGDSGVKEMTGVSKGIRNWFFALAFVSIGLESNFRRLAAQLAGGKPLALYIVGQTFNIVLTLLAAWLAFGGVLFPAPEVLAP